MSTTILLNPMDHASPSIYVCFCFYLRLKDGVTPADAFTVLHNGLSRTIEQLPWLGGSVFPSPRSTPGWRPGQLEIRYKESIEVETELSQLRFKELDEDAPSYEELEAEGFPLDSFTDEQLMWAPGFMDPATGPPCFVGQANFIEGGCIVCTSLNHVVADGTGSFDIWKLWASNCAALRGESERVDVDIALTPASSDRQLLDRIWTQESASRMPADVLEASTWTLVNLTPSKGNDQVDALSDHEIADDLIPYKNLLRDSHTPPGPALPARPGETMQSALFYMSRSNWAMLQQHCGGNSISANDALCAFVWRGLLKASCRAALKSGRVSDEASLRGAEARLYMPRDARPDFSAAVPQPYLGNLFVSMRCSIPLKTLTEDMDSGASSSKGPAAAAREIRRVAADVTPRALHDAYTLSRSVDDFSKLPVPPSSLSSFTLLITSLLMLLADEILRFGGSVFAHGGRIDALRPLMGRVNQAARFSFLLPRKKHGGVEFVVNGFADELEELKADEEFAEFAEFFCS